MTYILNNNSLQNYQHLANTSFVKDAISTTIEYYDSTGFTYTPASNATNVIIECNLQIAWNPDTTSSYPCTRLQYSTDSTDYENGTWTTITGTQMREGTESADSDYVWHNFMYVFILSSWSGERKLRLAGRSYDSGSEYTVGRSYKASGSEGVGSCPLLSIYSVV